MTDQTLRRGLRALGGSATLDAPADRLPRADPTTLPLEGFPRRATGRSPADVARRYSADRFVRPAPIDFRVLRQVEDALLAALPGGVEAVTLAPLTPLGTHSAVATVDPRKVVATIRGTEVAADPTNGLALEAAARRAEQPRSAGPIRLAAVPRGTRAQF